MAEDWLLESLKTIKNITETATILWNIGRHELVATQLELLFVEAQNLVDDHCIEDSDYLVGANPVGYSK